MTQLRLRRYWGTVSLSDIEEVERQVGYMLPLDYRTFLLETNGGRPERDIVDVPTCKGSPEARIHYFFGTAGAPDCYNLLWPLAVFEDLPPGALVFARTGMADTFYLTASGEIFFWDGYDGTSHRLAGSFTEFLGKLYRDEDSPTFE